MGTLQATNNNDISNECSFNIVVQNSCNTNGPIVDGCEDLIYLETENNCSTNDGNECVVLDTNGMGAICHDSCGCSINHLDLYQEINLNQEHMKLFTLE